MSNEQILKPKSHLFGRLRLLILSLPFVAAVLLLRFVIQEIFNVSEVATFAEIGSVITGVTLILGFMLGGVLADYKESERLPASLAVALSGFAATASAGMTVKDISDPAVQQRIARVGQAMREWFLGRVSDDELWQRHSDVSQLIIDLERQGVATHYLSRLMVLNGEMTNVMNRIAVIRNTSFVQSGYVLMTFLVVTLQASLAVVTFPSPIMSWVAPSVLSLAYGYLLLLVRDLDNPFGHGENNGQGSGADVDIRPVMVAVQQLG